jgi:hypothetical protein
VSAQEKRPVDQLLNVVVAIGWIAFMFTAAVTPVAALAVWRWLL